MRKTLNQKENMKKNKYGKNSEPKTKIVKRCVQKKCSNKIEKFSQQIRQFQIIVNTHWDYYKLVRIKDKQKQAI